MRPLYIDSDDRILIVAPHQDDETIGCGGIMLRYGKQCDVWVVTDGQMDHEAGLTDAEFANIRNEESKKAAEIAGVRNVIFSNIPNGMTANHFSSLKSFDLKQYSCIFIPNRNEEHKEHRAVNEAVRRMVRRQHIRAQVFEYEVWAPLPYPNTFLDISDVYVEKDKMISCYESQLKVRDYHAMVRGLALYRGVLYHTDYAEGYEQLGFRSWRKKILFSLPIKTQELISRMKPKRG